MRKHKAAVQNTVQALACVIGMLVGLTLAFSENPLCKVLRLFKSYLTVVLARAARPPKADSEFVKVHYPMFAQHFF